MKYNVRCSRKNCQARKVLSKHPDEYKITPVCDNCGGRQFRIDRHRMTENHKAKGCTCAGYQWSAFGGIHRKGSKFCWYRADGTQRMPGDPDFNDPTYDEAMRNDAWSGG
jgi:hypothetical protein